MKNWVLFCLSALCCLTSCQGQPPIPEDSVHITAYKRLSDSANNFATAQDTGKAIAYYQKALTHARRHGLHEHEARALVHIALLLKGQQ